MSVHLSVLKMRCTEPGISSKGQLTRFARANPRRDIMWSQLAALPVYNWIFNCGPHRLVELSLLGYSNNRTKGVTMSVKFT